MLASQKIADNIRPGMSMNSDALAARIEHLLGSSPSSGVGHLPLPPPPVPDHEILSRIGGGSYGEVWLARGVTGALRAVKVVWRRRFASDRPYEREFHGIVQFEPLSRSHPAVVNILHIGRDDAAGCFFYVMELADDGSPPSPSLTSSTPHPSTYHPRTLASELKLRGRLTVTDALSLGVHLAGALGHLHRHGLVHRDVKPSNVIYVHGQPQLADIGLVTSIHEEHSFVGTEGFIPPEGPGTERADLFGLGRLLYEASTGQNRSDFPALPDDLDRWARNEREALLELNEVLARACAPDAKRRHGNAAELAGDLNLILAGRSVRRAYRVERRLRRATLVSAVALLLVLVTIFSNWVLRRQRELSDTRAARETLLRERAERAEHASQQQLYTALLEQARATVLGGELGHRTHALDAVRRAAAISNSVPLRAAAIAALLLPDLPLEREWPVPSGLTMAQLDPPFDRVALCRGPTPVEIRSVHDQRVIATLPASTNRSAYVSRWSPDGRFLAIKRDLEPGAERILLEVWDVGAERRVLLIEDVTRNAFSFHPTLPRLLVETASTNATIWDLERPTPLSRFRTTGEGALVRYSPQGDRFAALRADGDGWAITIHDSANGDVRLRRKFPEITPDYASDFDWHPSGRWMALSDRIGAIHWMDTHTGEARLLGRHKAAAVVTVVSPDGRYLFTGGWDRELLCWDLKTLRRAFTIGLDRDVIQLRSDGRQCAVFQGAATGLQLRAFETPALRREFAEDLGGGRTTATFSDDGRWLAACGGERLVLWDLSRDAPGAVIDEKLIRRISFAASGELFASRIGGAFRWRITPGLTAQDPPRLDSLPLAASDDLVSLCVVSNQIAFSGTRGSKLVPFPSLAAETGAWKPTPDGLNGASPDGRWLGMFRNYEPDLYVYRLPGLEPVARLKTLAAVSQFEFSPRGDEVATTSASGVEFWSTATWQRTRHLTNFTGIVYSTDARTLWLSTHFRSAALYDATTAALLLPLPAGTLPLTLSPDGRFLAASVNGQQMQVWDLAEVKSRMQALGLAWAEPR